VQGKLIETEDNVQVIAKPGAVLLVNASPASAGVHYKVPGPLVNVWGTAVQPELPADT
jgi:hypothetical protein